MQEVISQKIRRTCQGCDAVQEWELISPSENTINQMQEWYTVLREILVDGHFEKLCVQACCLACVPAAAVKLALPTRLPEPAINLADLQVGHDEVN